MRTAIVMLLVVGGLLLIPTAWTTLGVGMLGASWLVQRRTSVHDTDRMIGMLVLLGAAGAGVALLQFLSERL